MTTEQSAPAAAALNPNKALWEKGDFTQIAASMREAGDALVDTLGVTPDMNVLDLGCGDGTTAVPAARRGARVLGVDIAANLVAAGNVRAREAGLSNLFFREGDASLLDGIEDDRFDLVISIFGAMFAPKPFDVAREMVRVTRPGGRIVMGNWIPGDPTLVAQILKISAEFTPPPPEGFVSPVSWGVVDNVKERFTTAGISPDSISCTPTLYSFRLPHPPASLLDTFRHYYGPTMNAFDAAEKEGRAGELYDRLSALFEAQNEGGPGETVIAANFLKVVVVK
jgi:SAM-dependent methyltransferase